VLNISRLMLMLLMPASCYLILMLLRCQLRAEDFQPSVDVDDAPTLRVVILLLLMLYQPCVFIDDDDVLILY
jgi:hypothetical protein